ncbi:MAG TPA: 16S rRNA (cytosine(1402)-N(4))-methyltransferase RsmH [Anaerolineaceae bacterium]|nr:16S rRNA (cytosine(1402)-N(4))-methyltransferase RsmH [Anaerolineaceae bacterium]
MSDQDSQSAFPPHVPVLYQLVLSALSIKGSGFYVDATLGAGGHACGILDACEPDGRLLGLDVDPQALAIASRRLTVYGERAIIRRASYATLSQRLAEVGVAAGTVDGILIDLGASSMQFDTPERGFSFQADGALDMRFDPGLPQTAADLVNDLGEQELADILWRYGEETHSRRIARAILQARPLHTTRQLAEVVQRAVPRKGGRSLHPATLTFQALRIAVNQELQAIESFLPQAVTALAPGGRLVVISFHSLEDRLVKHFLRRESRDCICPPQQPVCTCGHKASLHEVTRHPLVADETEIQSNPRSRSAKLRVAEKL